MSDLAVRRIYESRIQQYIDQKGYGVAFQNVPFQPPTIAADNPEAGVYLRVYVLPARTTSEDLEGRHRCYRGVVQIDVVTPRNIGPGLAGRLAAELDDLFQVNLRLTDANGFVVQVMTPASPGPEFPGEAEYAIPVSFEYRADRI